MDRKTNILGKKHFSESRYEGEKYKQSEAWWRIKSKSEDFFKVDSTKESKFITIEARLIERTLRKD